MPPFSNNMKHQQHNYYGNLPLAIMKPISEDETLSGIDLTTMWSASLSSAARRPAYNDSTTTAMSNNNWRSRVVAAEENDDDAPRVVMSYHTKRTMMLEQGYTEQEIARAMKRTITTGKKTTSAATSWKKSIHQRVKGVLLKIR